jgi:hypothetical protein
MSRSLSDIRRRREINRGILSKLRGGGEIDDNDTSVLFNVHNIDYEIKIKGEDPELRVLANDQIVDWWLYRAGVYGRRSISKIEKLYRILREVRQKSNSDRERAKIDAERLRLIKIIFDSHTEEIKETKANRPNIHKSKRFQKYLATFKQYSDDYEHLLDEYRRNPFWIDRRWVAAKKC